MKKVQSGFTLIELMIVVAIIAILAAIAIPAYDNYLRETRMQKVRLGAQTAYTSIKGTMGRRAAESARGVVLVALTSADLIAIANPDARTAPIGGGPAYVAGAAVDATGQIGLTAAGAAGSETVTIAVANLYDITDATDPDIVVVADDM